MSDFDDYPAEEFVVVGVTNTYRALADGRIRLTVDIDPEYRIEVARNYGEVGLPIAIARLSLATDKARQLKKQAAGHYGQIAKTLRQSGFFRSPMVWAAIGADEDFLVWLRLQPCAYCNAVPNGERPTEAAHVRRVADGAGVAIKPKYAAIPLCHEHHALQHVKGESALGGRAWFDKQRIIFVERWAWEKLKGQFGYESWNEIPPAILASWAFENGLEGYLPQAYQDAADNGAAE